MKHAVKSGRWAHVTPHLTGPSLIALAMAIMNASLYAFTALAARLLGPHRYGGLATLLAVMMVLNVVAMGFQITAARRRSVAVDDRPDDEHFDRAAALAGGVLVVAVLALAPALNGPLGIHSITAIALLAIGVGPSTVTFAWAGVLQGGRHWRSLGVVYAAVGTTRVAFGLAGMLWRADVVGAMTGVALGSAAAAAVAWWQVRRHAQRVPRVSERDEQARIAPPHSQDPLVREVTRNSYRLLAFVILANSDVLASRIGLSARESGLYAAGLIFTKIFMFLPEFVTVTAVPRLASDTNGRAQRLAFAVIGATGAVGVLAVGLLGHVLVGVLGASSYAGLESRVWVFAGMGVMLGLVQLVVYASMARSTTLAVPLIWGGAAVLLVVGSQVHQLTHLLIVAASVQAGLLCTLVLLPRLRRRSMRANVAPPLILPTTKSHTRRIHFDHRRPRNGRLRGQDRGRHRLV